MKSTRTTPNRESSTVPMTSERIAELHYMAAETGLDGDGTVILAECLDEIERLRSGLQTMHDDPLSSRYTLRYQAWQLLSGYDVEAVG